MQLFFSEMLESISQTLSFAAHQFLAQVRDLEYYTAAIISVMIVLLIGGSLINNKIAKKSFTGLESVAANQFASPVKSLYKESNNHFFAYSTGRQGCSGMMCSFHLSPRQDFISRFLVSWFWPSWYTPDRVVIEVQGAEIDDCVSGLICKKFQSTRLTEKFLDIKKFGKTANSVLEGGAFGASYSTSSLTGYTFIGDAGGKAVGLEVFSKIASLTIPGFLDKLKYVYICGEKKSVEFEIDSLPQTESEWGTILEFVLTDVLDRLVNVRVSENVRNEVLKQRSADAAREKEASEKDAKEEAANKRAADKKKERDEMLRRMTPEQAAKFEEKERKREMKKRMTSGRMYM